MNAEQLRLDEIMTLTGAFRLADIAKAAGLPAQNLYDIKSGKCGFSSRVCSAIKRAYPEFSLEWLISGIGEPKEVKKPQKERRIICEDKEQDIEYLTELIKTQKELIDSLKEQIELLKK